MLSIILPFYHKTEEFKIALEYNKRFLNSNIELIIPIDEPDSEEVVLDTLSSSGINSSFKIKSNKVPHSWRNPAKAINVGLRMSSGTHALIMSPESILVSDVYKILLDHCNKSSFAVGRVSFFNGDLPKDITSAFDKTTNLYYGSICAPLSMFYAVKGYNENYNEWGRDDDDIRQRLSKAGYKINFVGDAEVLHFEKKKTRPENLEFNNLEVPFTNSDNWGFDF
jgi:hypothetical protein